MSSREVGSSIRREYVKIDVLFLVTIIFLFALQMPLAIASAYGLCMIYAGVYYRRVHMSGLHFAWLVLAISACAVSAVTLNHGLTPLFYLAVTPLLWLAASAFCSGSLRHIQRSLQYVFILFVLGISLGLIKHWGEPEPLGEIIPGTSANGLPSYLIIVQIALSLSYYFRFRRLPVLSPLLTLTIALFGLGRGSIITASLIVIVSVLANAVWSRAAGRKLQLLVLLAAPMVLLTANASLGKVDDAVDAFIATSRFSNGVLDEHRGQMLTDYLAKLDLWSTVFGASYAGTSINTLYGGNPHNSFIRVHSFYGAVGVTLPLLSVLFLVRARKRTDCKLVSISLVALALLRATTEPILFPTVMDFFYFTYFFLYFRYAASAQPHAA